MSLVGFPAAFAKPYHVFLKPLRLQQNVAVKVFKSETGGPLRERVLNPYSALEKTQLYESGPTLLTSTSHMYAVKLKQRNWKDLRCTNNMPFIDYLQH